MWSSTTLFLRRGSVDCRKSQIDYFLDRKLVRDVSVIGGEECALQHRLLVCNLHAKSECKEMFLETLATEP